MRRLSAAGILFGIASLVVLILFIRTASIPLLGAHPWRQADTLFTGYFFCQEDSNILHPRIAQRGDTSGIAVGEFPLYSWLISIPCQITGSWSESFPKAISLFFFFATAIVLSTAVNQRFRMRLRKQDLALLFLSSSLSLSFLTRTMPDGLALFCFALGGYFWTKQSEVKLFSLNNLAGTLFTILAFLIRPYMIGLSLLFIPFRISIVAVFGALILFAYKKWFLEWTQTSTVHYYLINRKPLGDVITELPAALAALVFQLAKDHLNYVLLPFFIAGFGRKIWLGLLWIITAGLVIGTSGKHFSVHQYYLLAVAMVSLLIAYFGLPKRAPVLRSFILFVFTAIGIANTQHHFHAPNNDDWKTTQALVDATVPEKTKIVSLNSTADFVPIYLYYAKRTGWSLLDTPENRVRACSLGAAGVLFRENERLVAKKCENF